MEKVVSKPFPEGPCKAQFSDTRPRGLSEFPEARKLPKVFHYVRPFQLPYHPSNEIRPEILMCTILRSEEIEEFRFMETPDPFDQRVEPYVDKMKIKFDKCMGWTSTRNAHDRFYGFSFPIPVLDVRVWLKSEAGAELELLNHHGRIQSVMFETGIPTGIPYFHVEMSWTIDPVTFKLFATEDVKTLHKFNMPFQHYGLYANEVRKRENDKYREKLSILNLELKVDTGDKMFTPMPVQIDLTSFINSRG